MLARDPGAATPRPTPPSPPASRRSAAPAAAPAQPRIGRWNDNELILFFEERRESWIVYPPRSAYEFIHRPSRDAAVVEFHPWLPMAAADLHPVRPRDGCLLHGLECAASAAIQAAVDTGFDPFR